MNEVKEQVIVSRIEKTIDVYNLGYESTDVKEKGKEQVLTGRGLSNIKGVKYNRVSKTNG
jgi:hypothetical protein